MQNHSRRAHNNGVAFTARLVCVLQGQARHRLGVTHLFPLSPAFSSSAPSWCFAVTATSPRWNATTQTKAKTKKKKQLIKK